MPAVKRKDYRTYKCDDPEHWTPVTSSIVRCVHCQRIFKRSSSARHRCEQKKAYEKAKSG